MRRRRVGIRAGRESLRRLDAILPQHASRTRAIARRSPLARGQLDLGCSADYGRSSKSPTSEFAPPTRRSSKPMVMSSCERSGTSSSAYELLLARRPEALPIMQGVLHGYWQSTSACRRFSRRPISTPRYTAIAQASDMARYTRSKFHYRWRPHDTRQGDARKEDSSLQGDKLSAADFAGWPSSVSLRDSDADVTIVDSQQPSSVSAVPFPRCHVDPRGPQKSRHQSVHF